MFMPFEEGICHKPLDYIACAHHLYDIEEPVLSCIKEVFAIVNLYIEQLRLLSELPHLYILNGMNVTPYHGEI